MQTRKDRTSIRNCSKHILIDVVSELFILNSEIVESRMNRIVSMVVVILLLPLLSSSKNLLIEGSIKNQKTNEKIAYANVAISGTYIGTVSNLNGEFRLVVPESLSNKSISFSAIGYESFSKPINEFVGRVTISLQPLDYQLGEVVVMPDSTLLTLLRKAYKKIPDNYPDYPTRSIGFYREYLKLKDSDFLYLSEAILDVYKTSYENSIDGQVKLLKSRKSVTSGSDTINRYQFYGGIYFPHKADIVKRRFDVLKPSKEYNYSLKKVDTYNGHEVYCISFSPDDDTKAGLVGEFYLDKESLAYIRFEYCYNDKKLAESDNDKLFNDLKTIENKKIRIYERINGRYYFKSGFSKELFLNKVSNKLFEISDEYILTELDVDSVRQIPFGEQAPYSTVISDVAQDYSLSDWKDYTILENESISQSLFIKKEQADSLLIREDLPSKRDFFDKLFKYIDLLETDITLAAYPVSVSNGDYALHLNFPDGGNLKYQSTSADESLSFQYEMAIKYKLSKYLKLFFNSGASIISSEKSFCNNGGIEYSIPLKTYGKRIFYSANAGYGFLKFMKSMGEIDNEAEFKFGGKKLDSDKIEAFRGIKLNGMRLGSDLSFQISNFWYLKLFGGWQFNFNQSEKVRLEEKKGFFLGLKSAEENLSGEGVDFFLNGEKSSSAQFHFQNYFVGLGLKWSF